eukprot:1179898-Alexandrium_andersonii.AAC.1
MRRRRPPQSPRMPVVWGGIPSLPSPRMPAVGSGGTASAPTRLARGALGRRRRAVVAGSRPGPRRTPRAGRRRGRRPAPCRLRLLPRGQRRSPR